MQHKPYAFISKLGDKLHNPHKHTGSDNPLKLKDLEIPTSAWRTAWRNGRLYHPTEKTQVAAQHLAWFDSV